MYKSMSPNLMVENVEATIEFYLELGFIVVNSVPKDGGGLQFAIMMRDNLIVMFQDRESLTSEYPILSVAKTQPSISLYIVVDDVKKYFEELKDKCEILSALHQTFYGATEFAIKDNNGYVLTFTEAY